MRRRLVLLTVTVLAASLALFTVAFWLLLHGWLRHDASALLASRARGATALVAVDGGRLVLEETPGDEAVEPVLWLYDPGLTLVARPPGDRSLDQAARALAAGGPGTRVVGQVELRAVGVQDGTRHVGMVVVALSLAPYTHSERLAVGAAALLDVLVLAGAALLARRLVGSALRPVAAMTACARDWGAHAPDQRFGLGPPRDEITGLAATLDGLLTRLAASLRHEALVTSQIAHELKAPLARLRAVAETSARYDAGSEPLRATLGQVVDEVDQLTGVVETLLKAHGGSATTGEVDLVTVANRAARAAPSGTPVTVDGTAAVALCDPELAERMLAPIVANALRYARGSVTLRLDQIGATADGREAVRLAVLDDGPGFAAGEADAVFEPGYRGAAATGDGAGLGLPLARRLARLAGGDVRVVPEPRGHVVLTLPAPPVSGWAEQPDTGWDDIGPDATGRPLAAAGTLGGQGASGGEVGATG
ncbi:HAMP domain-containing histidine kinase [Frankia sp. AgB1.9]|uniref:sensor histidine kinase n=1 Tax=unclassified Frankia TaxID=2632575 RepID=UPI00193148C4|nr:MULTISPECIES: HAMP domain-containing sensor histidine kinase [unclassified Frankia]MBL7488574.1 HAMP domain-containing histidine kinase [Frankia sp. AgW1.1]MBL7550608.1 HAMP domain-containing histidine kinase [Frankia sp. AgB1.9]MBL7619799.1 HAMP domain-containing histidine kinase [Frankia sp. AgB1.8]